MKAQRIRKLLWGANLALGAGVAGVAALVLFDRPVEAKAAPAWATQALESYKKLVPEKVLQPAVEKDEIEKLILKPEWRGLPYYPYAGPPIPAKVEAPTGPTEAPKGPEGLEAIGSVYMLIFSPRRAGQTVASDTSVLWKFKDGKTRAISPGEFFVQKDQKGRFRLTDVVPLDADLQRLKLLYEVYDDPAGKPVSTGELIFDNTPKDTRDIVTLPGDRKPKAPEPAPAPSGGAAGARSATVPAGGGNGGYTVVGPENPGGASGSASKEWRAEVRAVSANRRQMSFDQGAYDYLRGKTVEQVLENVRTEDYNKNGVQGVALFPVGDTSLADRFDVRRNDILIAINGQPARTRADAIRIAQALPKDTTLVTVEIDRDGKRLFYDIDPRDPKARRAAAGLRTQGG